VIGGRYALFAVLLCGFFRGVLLADMPEATENSAPPPMPRFARCVIIKFDGEINPPRGQYLRRQLQTARTANADLVILQIESPGGELYESLDLAHELRRIDWAHTVAYVPREALSGAAIISLGCDEIILHPDAHFGDAGAVSFDVELWSFQHADEKVRSHLAQNVRDLAASKGRPPSIAEAMVDRELEVYQAKNLETGEIQFLSAHELETPELRDKWERQGIVLEARKGRFLEVNGERAVELRLGQATVRSREELLDRYGVDRPERELEWTRADANSERMFHVAMFLSIPLITGILIVAGIVGLLIEFSSPGTAIGGIVAAVCFTLFFWSHYMGGTSGWLEVMLFLLGMALLGLEVFVIPGFGICGFAGIAMIGISLILAGQDFVLPRNSEELSRFASWLLVLSCSAVATVILTFVGSRYFKTIPIFNRLVLDRPSVDAPAKETQGRIETTGLGVGSRGVAATLLRPGGKVRFGDQLLDVVADGAFVEKGAIVVVDKIVGHRIIVRPDDGPSALATDGHR
jgi:membrane-bound serine protease (ClpP class)